MSSSAMERLLTSLVFCEAPLDLFAYGGAPASTGGDVPSSRPAAVGPAAEARGHVASSHVVRRPARSWQAECAPAFDGLNCFETVVMPARSSSRC